MRFQAEEALQIYIDESRDHLADLEKNLLLIEEEGATTDVEKINKVFRCAHSIKGGAGFLGFNNIKELAHKMENLLGMFRDQVIVPNTDLINILLKATDTLKDLLEDPEESKDADVSKHIKALKAACKESEETKKTVLTQTAVKPPPQKTRQEIKTTPVPPLEAPSAQGEEPTPSAPDPIIEQKAGVNSNVTPKISDSEDNESIQVYIEESVEHLADIETDILTIEQNGENIDEALINKVFRAAHSIKGGAGFLGFTNIKNLAHKLENLMGLIRSREIIPDEAIINALLKGTDTLRNQISNISESNNIDISDILQTVVAATENAIQSIVKEQSTAPIAEEPPSAPPPATEKKPPTKSPASKQDKPKGTKPARPAQSPPASTLRVKTALLDSLMSLAGELVLSRNQLMQASSSKDGQHIDAVSQHIDLITSELQEAIMNTRMQPIGNVFSKFPRLIRDLAQEIGKEVELKLIGEDVELDKTIIEAISDPLTHLIRNSVDHGIESPAERLQKHKPAKGQIILSAAHVAGHVVIEIKDDGHGMDGEKFADHAIAMGLLDKNQARAMSATEKLFLIMKPGFSTAKVVTDVSGRGVGMDVVKTNFEMLSGQINISSQIDVGTTISIKLPLTLAIITSQVIRNGGERYAIPQVGLVELLRIPASQVKQRIERVGNADVVRLRDALLPLAKLSDVLGMEEFYVDPNSGILQRNRRTNLADRRSKMSPLFIDENDNGNSNTQTEEHPERINDDRRYHAASALNIMIVTTGILKYGLVVDELLDSEEIVVKPLGCHLKNCGIYAGATIMGDGRISLILDINNIARAFGLTSVEESDRALEIAAQLEKNIKEERQALLVFRSAEDQQFAVPLNQVIRIEKIKKSQIEEIGGKRAIQYRGTSLPLFSIDEVVNVKPLADHDDLLVLIFLLAGHEVGLLATNPINAMEIKAEINDRTHKQVGVMGSALIEGTTTLYINIYDIFQTLNPQWFAERARPVSSNEEKITLLIAEDSTFFRNQIKSFLEAENYSVLEAVDGVEALSLLATNHAEISLIITDIEMPNLDGLGFAEAIRSRNEYNRLPIIALTTLAGEKDIARGKAAGIDRYLIKMDKENLMATIHELLTVEQ